MKQNWIFGYSSNLFVWFAAVSYLLNDKECCIYMSFRRNYHIIMTRCVCLSWNCSLTNGVFVLTTILNKYLITVVLTPPITVNVSLRGSGVGTITGMIMVTTIPLEPRIGLSETSWYLFSWDVPVPGPTISMLDYTCCHRTPSCQICILK